MNRKLDIMNKDTFAKTIKLRIALLVVYGIFLGVISFLQNKGWIRLSGAESFALPFRAVLIICGIAAVAMIYRYGRALENEYTIEAFYKNWSSEHEQELLRRSGCPILPYCAAIVSASGIICAFFSQILFYAFCALAVALAIAVLLLRFLAERSQPN